MFYYSRNFTYMKKCLKFGGKKFHQTHSFNTPAYTEPESLLKVLFLDKEEKVIKNRKFASDRV